MSEPSIINHHTALIYVMVLVSASDGDMTDAELNVIGRIVDLLPVFADYDRNLLPKTAATCADVLSSDNGLEDALDLIKASLPPHLRETAYAIACDVAAADRDAQQEELRLLEMLRWRLNLDRLTAAAIERGSRARFAVE